MPTGRLPCGKLSRAGAKVDSNIPQGELEVSQDVIHREKTGEVHSAPSCIKSPEKELVKHCNPTGVVTNA